MSTECKKPVGQVLYEALFPKQPSHYAWEEISPELRDFYARCAEAVVDHSNDSAGWGWDLPRGIQ
jgi:hypothetical protein